MKLEDQLHEAMLREAMLRGIDGVTRCTRCEELIESEGTDIVIVDRLTDHVYDVARICAACHADFVWFLDTPPEQPDASSDTMLGTTTLEVSDGPTPSDRA